MSGDGIDDNDVAYACDECGEPLKAGEHFRCFTCQQQWLEAFCTRRTACAEVPPENNPSESP